MLQDSGIFLEITVLPCSLHNPMHLWKSKGLQDSGILLRIIAQRVPAVTIRQFRQNIDGQPPTGRTPERVVE